eukprot:CAMPEP_0184678876 /NCGR_PEP_ID=MMETSP0312-20130426/1685_1 /TAXON_ID=31354 /ORGANISM="Compsopogon coeruleus, Strain SAG 36.94" /LENGTH=632 /DNA_ID=CAMNT_0027127949 /DNA_START=591 /DNA_END=2489 /DNA_ORIENTATION=+
MAWITQGQTGIRRPNSSSMRRAARAGPLHGSRLTNPLRPCHPSYGRVASHRVSLRLPSRQDPHTHFSTPRIRWAALHSTPRRLVSTEPQANPLRPPRHSSIREDWARQRHRATTGQSTPTLTDMSSANMRRTGIRAGDITIRVAAQSLVNPYMTRDKKAKKPPPAVTAFALVYTRLSSSMGWTMVGKTAPVPFSEAPVFSEAFDIPFDLRYRPEIRVELFDLTSPQDGMDNLQAQLFLGAAEYDVGQIIRGDLEELTHRLQNDIDERMRKKTGTLTVIAIETRGSTTTLLKYAQDAGLLRSKVEVARFLLSADGYELRAAGKDSVSPFVVYFWRRAKDDRWRVVGRSKTVQCEPNPKFNDQFPVDMYNAEGYLRVEAYNQISQSDDLLQQQFIGATEVKISRLAAAPNRKGRLALINSLVQDIKPGEVTLRLEAIDSSRSKIFIDIETNAIKKKGIGGGRVRMSYRLSIFSVDKWAQVFSSPFHTPGEDASSSAPGVRMTINVNEDTQILKTEPTNDLVGASKSLANMKSNINWERAVANIQEAADTRIRIEFVHQKKDDAPIESLGLVEATLHELRSLEFGKFLPVSQNDSVVGKLFLKHMEQSDLPKYFSLRLLYGESARFKGVEPGTSS